MRSLVEAKGWPTETSRTWRAISMPSRAATTAIAIDGAFGFGRLVVDGHALEPESCASPRAALIYQHAAEERDHAIADALDGVGRKAAEAAGALRETRDIIKLARATSSRAMDARWSRIQGVQRGPRRATISL
jgi:hypothetical protein